MATKKKTKQVVDCESAEEAVVDNTELYEENASLTRQLREICKQYVDLEDRYNNQTKRNRDLLTENENLRENLISMEKVAKRHEQNAANEKAARVQSVPKFVSFSAAALALLIVPCTLHKLTIIGPQLAYGIECCLMMAISWCHALIWDRTRK